MICELFLVSIMKIPTASSKRKFSIFLLIHENQACLLVVNETQKSEDGWEKFTAFECNVNSHFNSQLCTAVCCPVTLLQWSCNNNSISRMTNRFHLENFLNFPKKKEKTHKSFLFTSHFFSGFFYVIFMYSKKNFHIKGKLG